MQEGSGSLPDPSCVWLWFVQRDMCFVAQGVSDGGFNGELALVLVTLGFASWEGGPV